jgi:hypothetical protein
LGLGGKEEMGRLANYALSIVTTTVTIVTFVGFVTAKPLETWTKNNSKLIFYGLILFFMATGVSLNYFFEERKKFRQLTERAARVEPSEHDRKLFQNFITMLPPGGLIVEWLKTNPTPKAFRNEHYEVIQTVLKSMKLQAPGFDNSEVEASYGQLQEEMEKFETTILEYMHREDLDNPWLRIPPEWDDERTDNAIAKISKVRLELKERYDHFLGLAHKAGIGQ